MKMNIQRLRNLTTGRLHTNIEHVYQDLETITGTKGLLTHMLPRALDAVKPWLRSHVTDEKFWDGNYDPQHKGEYILHQPTDADRATMFARFCSMSNPLANKPIVLINKR